MKCQIQINAHALIHVPAFSYHNRRDGNDDNPAVGDAALASSESSLPRSSAIYALIASTIATSLFVASSA